MNRALDPPGTSAIRGWSGGALTARPRGATSCVVRRIESVTDDLADASRIASELRDGGLVRAEVRQRRVRMVGHCTVVFVIVRCDVQYEHDWSPIDAARRLWHCTTCHRVQARAIGAA
jgi:hypothetical protein